ncbi:hypothetical protein NQ314_014230 [Rhamnusium bicolor]|uniref:Uncharacterized protein n=1 Tax=Rhamnusium bicolor TaxID=1586634 RepID=A0AAV8X3J2_9CUCU|nr:hypothetical protein NQ314_014230 [Rhamnusium bicolor]
MGRPNRKRIHGESEEGSSERNKTLELEKRLRKLERHFRRESYSSSPKRVRSSKSLKGSQKRDNGEQTSSRGVRSSEFSRRSSTPVRSPRGSTPKNSRVTQTSSKSVRSSRYSPRSSTPSGSGGFTPPKNVVQNIAEVEEQDKENSPNNNILLVSDPELDQEILNCLGEDPEAGKVRGIELHKALVPRWKNILSNGMTKEIKTELMAKYPIPVSCPGLQTPILNLEIAQAVSDLSLKKKVLG